MKDYQTKELWETIKLKPHGYDYRIDQHYSEYGIVALRQLEICILLDKSIVMADDPIQKYVEDKIEQFEQDEIKIREQRTLDIRHKKRQLKWFYPMLVVALLGILVSGFSAWNNFIKAEKQKEIIDHLTFELDKLSKSSALKNNPTTQNSSK